MSSRLSKFKGQLRREKWLLLLCFFLAFSTWQAIRNIISFPLPVSNVSIEVEVPEGWAVLDKSLSTVDVRFLGSREDILYLNNETLHVVIPIEKPQSGKTMTVAFDSAYVKNPTDAKVVSFNPSEIEIKLDQEGEKRMPIKASFNGTLPEGLEIEQIVCTPATVRVKGAQQQLNKMENVRTEMIELKSRQASFKENVRLDLPQGGRLQAEPDRVSVEFTLIARSNTAVFEKVPVRVLCAPGERRRIDIQPLMVNVTVRGLQQRLDQVRSAEIFAYINCTELTESTGYDLPVNVELPSGLQLVKTEPAAVHVQIGNTN